MGDDFATPIHLDATRSSDKLTLVYSSRDPNAPPLKLKWSFRGAAVQITDGDDIAETLTIATAGDRPLFVNLRVENAAGGVSEATTTIAITPLDDAGACPLPRGP